MVLILLLLGFRIDQKSCWVDGGRKGDGSADGPDADQDQHHHQLGCLGGEGGHDGSPSVQGDGQHGEHTGRDRGEGDELVEGAVEGAKVPDS